MSERCQSCGALWIDHNPHTSDSLLQNCPTKEPMTDPAQSEVIALRAQIEEDKIATAEINEIVAKYQADDSALRATVKALRDALEKTRDECDRYMNQDEAIVGIANIFHIAHAALNPAKEN